MSACHARNPSEVLSRRMFRKLDPEQIVATPSRLERRIAERFPGAGLSQVAAELTQVTREAQALSAWKNTPNKPLRVLVSLAITVPLLVIYVFPVLCVSLLAAAATLRGETTAHNWADWV